jgi:hypothetical protein
MCAYALVQREFDWDRLDDGGGVGVRGKRLAIVIAGARDVDRYSVRLLSGDGEPQQRRIKRKSNIK